MRVIMSVINDLSYDQRVRKMCASLYEEGYEILLVGRKLPDSVSVHRPYKTFRFAMIFKSGALFYAWFNIRLFFKLVFTRADVLHCNDLDTLLANYLASKIKNIPLIYDAHEYFTEVPELENNKLAKNVWKRIESWILPKLENVFTVNDSIAKLYNENYGAKMKVIRNIPEKKASHSFTSDIIDENIPQGTTVLILQGAGINVDRGAEELVAAMQHVNGCVLFIIGSGDVIKQLKEIVVRNDLSEIVKFKGKLPYEQMMAYTRLADIGFTLDKDTNINYKYSLPNKLFDYINAEVSIIATDLVEVRQIIEKYEVGTILNTCEPLEIAKTINYLIKHPDIIQFHKNQCKFAAEQLSWESEVSVMLNVYKKLS